METLGLLVFIVIFAVINWFLYKRRKGKSFEKQESYYLLTSVGANQPQKEKIDQAVQVTEMENQEEAQPMIDRFCGKCGAPREADAAFCGKCGTRL